MLPSQLIDQIPCAGWQGSHVGSCPQMFALEDDSSTASGAIFFLGKRPFRLSHFDWSALVHSPGDRPIITSRFTSSSLLCIAQPHRPPVRPSYGGNSLTRSELRREAPSGPASTAIGDVVGTRGAELSAVDCGSVAVSPCQPPHMRTPGRIPLRTLVERQRRH